MHLFIDTTQDITIGLLDDKLSWMEYQSLGSKKSSAVLHHMIFSILKKHDLEISEIKSVLYSAGPGSYTGMRVSAGITDIFHWQNIKINSFYHFKIPSYVGVESGAWISKAFKGEYFIHDWEKAEGISRLVKEAELETAIEGKVLYAGHDNYDQVDIQLTRDLIRNEPSKIFSRIIADNNYEELYYFRPLEDEYTRSK